MPSPRPSPKERGSINKLIQFVGQMGQLPSAASINFAAANTVRSSNGRPIICTPIGNPSGERPAGTAKLGNPNTLNA